MFRTSHSAVHYLKNKRYKSCKNRLSIFCLQLQRKRKTNLRSSKFIGSNQASVICGVIPTSLLSTTATSHFTDVGRYKVHLLLLQPAERLQRVFKGNLNIIINFLKTIRTVQSSYRFTSLPVTTGIYLFLCFARYFSTTDRD